MNIDKDTAAWARRFMQDRDRFLDPDDVRLPPKRKPTAYHSPNVIVTLAVRRHGEIFNQERDFEVPSMMKFAARMKAIQMATQQGWHVAYHVRIVTTDGEEL